MANELKNNLVSETLVTDLKQIILQARQGAYAAVNACMISTYWKIGQRIVEEEQQGKTRAEYGKGLIEKLANVLTIDFGSNFNARNLAYYKKFYLYFPDPSILNARVQNLTWTHFRSLLRVPDAEARAWYLNEASRESWSSRTLDRNIGSQYYHRLLASQNKDAVKTEMKTLTSPMQTDKLEFIKNPVVAEFLGLTNNSDFTESQLEQSILTHFAEIPYGTWQGLCFCRPAAAHCH